MGIRNHVGTNMYVSIPLPAKRSERETRAKRKTNASHDVCSNKEQNLLSNPSFLKFFVVYDFHLFIYGDNLSSVGNGSLSAICQSFTKDNFVIFVFNDTSFC